MASEIETADALLAIWSTNYKAEYNKFSALERNAILTTDPSGDKAALIPILLEPVELDKLYGSRKGFYLYENTVEDLIEALKNRHDLLEGPTTRYVAPATFTTTGEKIDLRHSPIRSEPRQASATPIDTDQSERTRRALSGTASTV